MAIYRDRRIEVFNAVAKLGNFTRAGEALHMSQPAVTFQIRQFEDQLGTRLFDRSATTIGLTAAGACAAKYAEQLVQLYRDMDTAVGNLVGNVGGEIVIAASSTVSEYLLPSVLGQFQLKFPNVQFRLLEMNSFGVLELVKSNEADLGIIESPDEPAGLNVRRCWQDQLVLICHPDNELADFKSIRPEELLHHKFISREIESGTRTYVSQYLQHAGIDYASLQIELEFGRPESIKNAVEANLGIAILSEATVVKETQLDLLKAVPMDPPITRPFSMVFLPQKLRSKAIQEFMSFTENICQQRKQALAATIGH